jgi:hypothetical protein
MSEVVELLDDDGNPCTAVSGIHNQRTNREGIVIGYQAATRKVFVYRTTTLGENPEILERSDGENYWFILPEAASEPPRVFMADTYGKVFLAHDEPFEALRGETYYYDGTEGRPLRPLLADLDRTGTENPIKFRGVVTHLAYLLGWGFGHNTVKDRPEIVRASLPGEPTVFEPEHLWYAGQVGDPVLNVVPCGDVAVVLKEAELHQIVGYDRASFGIRPLDPHEGVRASHLAIGHLGRCYFWSADGPRVTNGQSASQDIAQDLYLQGFEPLDLVAAGDVANAFAAYLGDFRVLAFIFRQRAYFYSLWDPTDPKWSYAELSVPVFCAGYLYSGDSSGGGSVHQPTGYPKWVDSAEWDADAIQDFNVRLPVDNVGQDGTELLEVWLKNGGPWGLQHTFDVTGSARQEHLVEGLAPDTAYDVALRYRSGGLYTPGYEGDTPDDWTAPTVLDSMGSFVTTNTRRVVASAVWSRTSNTDEQVDLTWSGGDLAVSTDLLKSTNSGGSWSVEDNLAPGVLTAAYPALPGEAETEVWFKVRANNAGVFGADSNISKVWIGPLAPEGFSDAVTNPWFQATFAGLAPFVSTYPLYDTFGEEPVLRTDAVGLFIMWGNADPSFDVEIWTIAEGEAGFPGAFAMEVVPLVPGQTWVSFARGITVPGGELRVKIRHKVTSFTVDDFSDFTPVKVVTT